ncbi:MAG: VWA domain-containing protein, partial [Myxococcota bacterium]
MTFLQPLFLLGLLGAALPIIIHLIHRQKPRRQAFSAIELVIQSVQKVERRWRLRRFLLLAARVLLVAALALAAAQPLWGPDLKTAQTASGPQRVAIVVDATMSMRAKYEGTTSFARAIRQARNVIDAMGPEDMAVLVGAASPPVVLVERPTASKATLLDRLEDLKPTYGSGDLAEAVNTAVQALAVTSKAQSKPPGVQDDKPAFTARVIVLSDLAPSSLQGAGDLRVPGAEQQARLEIVDVLSDIPSEERQNRAITAMEAVHVPDQ